MKKMVRTIGLIFLGILMGGFLIISQFSESTAQNWLTGGINFAVKVIEVPINWIAEKRERKLERIFENLKEVSENMKEEKNTENE